MSDARKPALIDTQTVRLQGEVMAVDFEERVITGHAGAIGNKDRNGDVLLPGSFDRAATLDPADVAVFVGHNYGEIPIGIPLSLKADSTGLLTQTKISEGERGDSLLRYASELKARGKSLGMSIGYRVPPGGAKIVESEVKGGGTEWVREITDLDLMEYSYAPVSLIANPRAIVTEVKTEDDDMSDPTETRAKIDALAARLTAIGAAVDVKFAAMATLDIDTKNGDALPDSIVAELTAIADELTSTVEAAGTPATETKTDADADAAAVRLAEINLAAMAGDVAGEEEPPS